MDNAKYLETVLTAQTFAADDPELTALREKRDEVEGILRAAFPTCSPTIKYGGSHAKHTMTKASYDLDVICYFGNDERDAGSSLEAIYENVKQALATQYFVTPKTSALRIEQNHGAEHIYTHVDVVPGRFVDNTRNDVFLYQNGAEECRLKTNTKKHILHIRDSGVTPAIRLIKYWRHVFGRIPFKTFVLELSVIEILSSKKKYPLDEQLVAYWTFLRDDFDSLRVEDPANPTGNDLMPYLSENKLLLTTAADTALRTLERSGWQAIFGQVDDQRKRNELIDRIPVVRPHGAKPWGMS